MFCGRKQREKHSKSVLWVKKAGEKMQILSGLMISFFLKKKNFYVNLIQMVPATTEWFLNMFLAVCICYLEVPSLTLHKVLRLFSPHFLKGISYDQENSQNTSTSSAQAAQSEPSQPPSTTRLLIQVLSSPLAPTPLPLLGGKKIK